jgi:hypothetical protein
LSVSLDTSVLLPLLAQDAFTDRARAWFAGLAMPVVISDLAVAELAAALGAKQRRGEVTRVEAVAALDSSLAWRAAARLVNAEVTAADTALAIAWLRRFDLNLRTPDSMHLAIAARLGAPVATFDLGMEAAARALGIALAPD